MTSKVRIQLEMMFSNVGYSIDVMTSSRVCAGTYPLPAYVLKNENENENEDG